MTCIEEERVGGSVSHFIPAFLFIADNFFQSKNTPSKFMEDIAEDNGNTVASYSNENFTFK